MSKKGNKKQNMWNELLNGKHGKSSQKDDFNPKSKKTKKSKTRMVSQAFSAEKHNEEESLDTMLDRFLQLVQDGKFTQVKNYQSALRAFLEEYLNKENLSKEAPIHDTTRKIINFEDYQNKENLMHDMARKIIIIGKSFYEYSKLVFMDNIDYDALLAKYLSYGFVEPTGFIPKGSKLLKKVSITYPSLHNNMDKAYIIMENEPIPEGVKESDSVEAFLTRCFRITNRNLYTDTLSIEISPKIDGVSMNGTMDNGNLINPQTRGDTSQSVAILGLNKLPIADGGLVEKPFGIQYEAFVTEKNRIQVSKYLKMEKPYVSCRHAASGIIHRLSTMMDENLVNYLSFYPIQSEGLDGTYQERMDYLGNFEVVPDDMIRRVTMVGTYQDLLDCIKDTFHKMEKIRNQLSYTIDGIVITLSEDDDQEKLGRSGRTNKFQIALKFDPSTAVSRADRIELDTGTRGFRTIQLYLTDPVFLDGVRYDHVPILSAEIFDQLELRHFDKVSIHRVGDVIPAISVVEHAKEDLLTLPVICPDCKLPLIRKAKKLYCSNPDCPGNIRGKFNGMFRQMKMVGYGDSFSRMLVNTVGCRNLSDLLKVTPQDFQDKGVNLQLAMRFPVAFREALENSNDINVLAGMGLPGVGTQKARFILQNIPFDKITETKYDELLRVACDAVGENQGADLAMVMSSDTFKKELDSILPYVKNITTDFTQKVRVGHTGGNLSESVRKLCEDKFFEITDGKAFDVLITTSMDSDSSKMRLAKKKNLPIFTEDGFQEHFSELREKAQDLNNFLYSINGAPKKVLPAVIPLPESFKVKKKDEVKKNEFTQDIYVMNEEDQEDLRRKLGNFSKSLQQIIEEFSATCRS